MRIALVVGHDRIRQGARSSAGVKEFSFWHTFLHTHIADIAGTGHTFAIFTRSSSLTKGYTAKMKQLHKEIDEWNADLAIELHFNSSNNRNINGWEVLSSGSYLSMRYARIVSFYANLPCRGVKVIGKHGRGGGFLHYGKAPAIILEPFFGSSSSIDYTLLKKDIVAFLRNIQRDNAAVNKI